MFIGNGGFITSVSFVLIILFLNIVGRETILARVRYALRKWKVLRL